MNQKSTRSINWDEEEKVIDTCHTLDNKEREEQDDFQVSLDHEVEQVHITTGMLSEIPPLSPKLAPVQQGPSTSRDTSAPQASSSQRMPAQAPQRLYATVRSKAKGKGKKNIQWNYEVATFRLWKQFRELDYKRKMKEHEMLRAKHAMDVIEHELKVEILKKQLEQLENKN